MRNEGFVERAFDHPPGTEGLPERLEIDEVWRFDRFELNPVRRLLEVDGKPLHLGSRAIEVLIALVRSAGEFRTRESIISEVWGHEVNDINLRVQIAALRRTLGDDANGRRFIANEPGAGYRFVSLVHRDIEIKGAIDIRETGELLSPLPVPIDSPVARDALITDLVRQIPEGGVFTLTGAPGVGKSTVAVEVATRLRPNYAERVRYLDIAAIDDGWLKRNESQLALELTSRGGRLDGHATTPEDAQPARSLLLLDNCERSVTEVIRLLERLFADAAPVDLLVTSREPLMLPGEKVRRVRPLALPDPEEVNTLDEAMNFGAVQLFVSRLKAWPGLRLVDADVPALCGICRQLDGLPLAICLAAARGDLFGLRGLARDPADQFLFLTDGRRTALPHHRTLKATLDWSYDVLPQTEQHALRSLSIFQDHFSLEAARAVAGQVIPPRSVDDVLGQLVKKSLINVEECGAGVQYRLSSLVRAYAREKLPSMDSFVRVLRAHAWHLVKLLEAHARHLVELLEDTNPDSNQWPLIASNAMLPTNLGDIRLALDWLASVSEERTLQQRLLVASSSLWFKDVGLSEYASRLEAVLEAEPAPDGDETQMRLWFNLGHARLYSRGVDRGAIPAFEASLRIAVRLAAAHYRPANLRGMWAERWGTGDHRGALRIALRHRMLTRSGTAQRLASYRMLLMTHVTMGNHLKAADYEVQIQEAIHSIPFNAPPSLCQVDDAVAAEAMLARSLWMSGRAEAAMSKAFESLAHARELQHPLSECAALSSICCIALWTGAHEIAHFHSATMMALARSHSFGLWQRWAQAYIDCLELPVVNELQSLPKVPRGLVQSEVMATINDAFLLPEVLSRAEEGHTPWVAAEIFRAKGERLMRLETRQTREMALHYFWRAFRLARRQRALSWQLRAAISLARLLAQTSSPSRARALLVDVMRQFTEGFKTKDLVEAYRLMDVLDSTGH
jgi:predicted ATPase/DNA-binding winged helix-turn-helix (wHTH) protein